MNRDLSARGYTTARQKTVREIMTADVVALSVEDTLRLAYDMMSLANIHHLPVMESQEVIGIVSWADVMRVSLASAPRQCVQSLRETLGTLLLKDVALAPPTTIPPDASIQDAASLMVEKHLECLVVLEGKTLVGVATRTDLLKELAKG